MKVVIDDEAGTFSREKNGINSTIPLYSKESFESISDLWLKVGWNEKYPYTFSWMGVPIIQLPEDIVRVQEVVYRVKPDVVVETGIAHGGSLIFYASLCRAMGKGHVIGVDIEIKPHNRKRIEGHELSPYITLIEGSSTDGAVVEEIRQGIKPGETVLVILDSDHSRGHVAEELEAYSGLVTRGSYIVATDGFMKDIADVPRGKKEWRHDNPYAAAAEFVKRHPDFEAVQPEWPFNESPLSKNITHWPGAWLRKR